MSIRISCDRYRWYTLIQKEITPSVFGIQDLRRVQNCRTTGRPHCRRFKTLKRTPSDGSLTMSRTATVAWFREPLPEMNLSKDLLTYEGLSRYRSLANRKLQIHSHALRKSKYWARYTIPESQLVNILTFLPNSWERSWGEKNLSKSCIDEPEILDICDKEESQKERLSNQLFYLEILGKTTNKGAAVLHSNNLEWSHSHWRRGKWSFYVKRSFCRYGKRKSALKKIATHIANQMMNPGVYMPLERWVL